MIKKTNSGSRPLGDTAPKGEALTGGLGGKPIDALLSGSSGVSRNTKTVAQPTQKQQAAEQPKTVKAASVQNQRNSGGNNLNRQRRPQQTKSVKAHPVQEAKPQENVKKKTNRATVTQVAAEVKQSVKSRPVRNFQSRGRQETAKQPAVGADTVRIAFLGGLNEIGKNLTVYEYKNDIILVDCGMAFPDDDMPGIDLVIPDFSYLEKNADRIRGIVVTHGHEDHIGSIPYLLKLINVPIYGTALTIGLLGGKLKEHGLLRSARMFPTKPGQTVKLGAFEVEFIHVNHSIPDAVSFAIKTPAGVIVQTGDFKIDTTPIQGGIIDIARFAQLGKQGVLALLSDSTNAERPGYTMSEHKVGESFKELFHRAGEKRIIIATFASNVHRVQQIIDCAAENGRKVALSGRSMLNATSVANELGYLNVPAGILIEIDEINHYPKDKIVLITTGSQGEPMSALTRMAYSDHRQVVVGPEDYIIISANPIPGNEKTVGGVINELMKRGCTVVYESMYDVHVSGHACQEELKMMLGIVQPKYFIPVHGEQKHLRRHADLALKMGMKSEDVMVMDIGDTLAVSKSGIRRTEKVQAGRVLVDGLGVGDVGSVVLRDRKHLAQDGLIVLVVTIQSEDGSIVSGPDIVSRGFVYVRESEQLMDEIRRRTNQIVEGCAHGRVKEWGVIKNRVKEDISRLIWEKTKRNPMILPVIMEV